MKDYLRHLGCALGMAGALLVVASSGVAGAAPHLSLSARTTVNPVFRPLLPQLKGQPIPVLLPTYLPHQHDAGVHLFASVADRSKFGYLVDIGYAPGCGGATACRYGTVSGGTEPNTPTIFDYPKARHVRLHNGAPALFFPFTCGASCGDSILVFQVNGVVYTMSVKAGTVRELLAMANSATPVLTP